MTEQWKPVLGYEGLYEVSDQGRIRSLDRPMRNKRGFSTKKGQILLPIKKANDYLVVGLHSAQKRIQQTIHRLVYEAFNGPVPDGLVVRHVNHDRTDCRLANLLIGTPQDNSDDMVKAGRSHHGSGHYKALLSEDDVLTIRQSNETHAVIAKRLGVARSTVSKAKAGKNWSHV